MKKKCCLGMVNSVDALLKANACYSYSYRISNCFTEPFFEQVHFRRIIAPHTDVNLGDCSFLDTCRHMKVNVSLILLVNFSLFSSFLFPFLKLDEL